VITPTPPADRPGRLAELLPELSRSAGAAASAVLAVPYALLRVPLTVADHKLVGRLSKYSRPRVEFDRALGTLDCWAGWALNQPEIHRHGERRRHSAHDRRHGDYFVNGHPRYSSLRCCANTAITAPVVTLFDSCGVTD
jgi:hypothetical protein